MRKRLRFDAEGLVGLFSALGDYEVTHLVTHLLAAGDAWSVHSLLRMETADGNAWFLEKQRRADVGGYLDDVVAARDRAAAASDTAVSRGGLAVGLADEVRYALLLVSVNSVSRGLPPALVAALTRIEHWPFQQALRYADQQPFAPLRAEVFALLSENREERVRLDCLRQAVAAARAIATRPDWRVRALGQIAWRAPDPLRQEVLAEGLDVLQKIGRIEVDENSAALFEAVPDDGWPEFEQHLAGLAPTLSKPVRPGVDMMRGRPQPWTYGLRRFGEVLPRFSARLRGAVAEAARAEPDRALRAIGLAWCADGDEGVAEAKAAADEIVEPELRAEFDAVLAPRLGAVERRALLDGWRRTAAAEPHPATRAGILLAIAPVLPPAAMPDLARSALAACRLVEDRKHRSYLLRFLTLIVPDAMLPELVAETDQLDEGEDWGRVVSALAPRAPTSSLLHLLGRVRRIDDGYTAATALCALASGGNEATRSRVVSLAIAGISDPNDRAWSISSLMPLLSAEEFLAAAHAAAQLPATDRARALDEMARGATDDSLLAVIAHHGTPEQQTNVLLTRADRADPARRTGFLAEARTIVVGIEDLRTRLTLTAELRARGVATPNELVELLEAVRSSDWEPSTQADVLASLVSSVPAGDREDLVDEVLTRIAAVLDEQRPWVEQLVPHLRPLQYIPAEYDPSAALSALVPHVVERQWDHLLQVVGSVRSELTRTSVLTALATSAPAVLSTATRYFDIAHTIQALGFRMSVYCTALWLMNDQELETRLLRGLLREAERLRMAQRPVQSSHVLTQLAPHLTGSELDTAWAAAKQITQASVRDAALTEIVTRLPLDRAIVAAQEITTPESRRQVLLTLVTRELPTKERTAVDAAVAQLEPGRDMLPVLDRLPPQLGSAVIDAETRRLLSDDYPSTPDERVLDHVATAPLPAVQRLWADAAGHLADGPRERLLRRIAVAKPLLEQLAGPEALREIVEAIIEVRRWWP